MINIKPYKKIELPVDYTLLDPEEKRVVRSQYIEEQGGKCFYCGQNLKEEAPKEMTKKWTISLANSYLCKITSTIIKMEREISKDNFGYFVGYTRNFGPKIPNTKLLRE